MLKRMILLLSIAIGFSAYADKAPTISKNVVRYSSVESWSEPYGFFDENGNLVKGVIKEFAEEIAKKLGRTAEFVNLPKKRVDQAAESGQIDLRCYVKEEWVEKPGLYNWSEPILTAINVIAYKKGTAPIRSLTDLNGKTIGTVRGYRYPKLEQGIKKGKIVRSDAASENDNIDRLEKGRISYAIVELSSYNWRMKQAKSADPIEFFELEKMPMKCGLVKTSNISVSSFNAAIIKLKEEGFFDRLITKYGLVKQ